MKNPLIDFKKRIKEIDNTFILVEQGYSDARKFLQTQKYLKEAHRGLVTIEKVVNKQKVHPELKSYIQSIKRLLFTTKKMERLGNTALKKSKQNIQKDPRYILFVEQGYIWICSYLEAYLYNVCVYYIQKNPTLLVGLGNRSYKIQHILASKWTKKDIIESLVKSSFNKDDFDSKKEVDLVYNNLFGVHTENIWELIEPIFAIRNVLLHNDKKITDYCANKLGFKKSQIGKKISVNMKTYLRRKDDALKFAEKVYLRVSESNWKLLR